MHDALEAAKAAIKEAAGVRADLRYQWPDDRDHRLRLQLWALDDAREPLRRHLLRAPKATARYFAPEVRAASDAITQERRRVIRMLHGKSGKEGWLEGPKKPPKKPLSLSHLSGTVSQALSELAAIEVGLDDVEAVETAPPLGEVYFGLTADARELRNRAREARLRIAKAQKRVKLSYVFVARPPRGFARQDLRAEDTKRSLRECERRAGRIASAEPLEPLRPLRTWTHAEALEALDAWATKNEGRWPTARQLPKLARLPSRGTLGISLVRDAPSAR